MWEKVEDLTFSQLRELNERGISLGKKWILAIHVTHYLQKSCIPNSIIPHHYIGVLCRMHNISGWWQIWMLFTQGQAALDRQGGVCRRAAHYHSAATPALQSTGAWRTDTSLSFPVPSHLSLWQGLKRLWVSDIYRQKGKILNKQQNQAKLKLLAVHHSVLNSCTTVIIKWNWEVWYHTEMFYLTSWSCEQFQGSYCERGCYTEQES